MNRNAMTKTAGAVLLAGLALMGNCGLGPAKGAEPTSSSTYEVEVDGKVECSVDCWYTKDGTTMWSSIDAFMQDYGCQFANDGCDVPHDEGIRVDCDQPLVWCDDEGA